MESVDQNNNPITGYDTILRTNTGSKIASGFTTKTFTTGLTAGTNYQIVLDSYGACTFNHWQDTGSTANPRTFTAVKGPLTFVGVYTCTSSGSVGQPASLGLVMSAIMSEFGIPMALLAAALGSLAIVRTASLRIANRSTPV